MRILAVCYLLIALQASGIIARKFLEGRSANVHVSPHVATVNRSKATTWHCVGEGRNRSCVFKNLYYGRSDADKGDFLMFVPEGTVVMNNQVFRADKYELFPWAPRMRTFNSSEAIDDYVKAAPVIEQPGVSLQFNPLFPHNIGHALFDGLYPAYLSLVKLGLQDKPFRPVVATAPDCFDPDASPTLGMNEGDVLEAYLPHPRFNRSLGTAHVQVLSVTKKDHKTMSASSLCTFEKGMDSEAMQLDSKSVKPGADGQAQCCRMCADTIGCTVAVVFAQVCYIKGKCNKGPPGLPNPTCAVAREDRLLCRFNESARPQMDLHVRQIKRSAGSIGDGDSVEATIPSTWVVGKVRARCMSEGVYETFGKSKSIVRLFEMDRDVVANPDMLYHFESIVFGSGSAGNLVADETGAIGRSITPVDTMHRFRNRMLEAYGLPVEKKTKAANTKNKPLDVIFVDNKRLSIQDRQAFDLLIRTYNVPGKVNAEFIDWHKLGTVKNRFLTHLKRVQQADVYVSSIGTALQYVPFMKDHKVFIALGSLWQRDNRVFPTFMEQQLAGGGTPYLRTLYADPGAVLRTGLPAVNSFMGNDGYRVNVNMTNVMGLLEEAKSLVRSGFQIPVPIENNLSREGKLLVELCKQDPDTCRAMQADRNGAMYECATTLWPECIVYEVGAWGPAQNKCSLNRGLLRKLRNQYGLFSYGASEIKAIGGPAVKVF